jgi:hypothetical protein
VTRFLPHPPAAQRLRRRLRRYLAAGLLSVSTTIVIFAATSEQILMAASKSSGLQLAIASGRSVVAQAPIRLETVEQRDATSRPR